MRVRAGRTVQEVAEHMQASPASVIRWEKGLACPAMGKLKPLAEMLHCKVYELLDDDDP